MFVSRVVLLALSLLVSSPVRADDGICPDNKPAPTDPCTQVNDWNDLKTTITSATGDVVLCPFNITKTEREPLLLDKGVTIMCRKASDLDECIIRGVGEHFRIISLSDVVIAGLTFKESDEHAVYIQSGVDTNVHSLCDCTFEE